MIHVFISKFDLAVCLFDKLEGVNLIFMPIKKHNPIAHRMVKAAYYNLFEYIYSIYYPSEIRKQLKAIKPNDTLIVVGEDTYSYHVLSHFCKHVKNKIAYFWNPASSMLNQKVCLSIKRSDNKIQAMVKYIKSKGFKVATFDEQDAIKYGLNYVPQFYRKPEKITDVSIKQDFFFCGREKGRKEIVEYYRHRLSVYGNCDFYIVDNRQRKDALAYKDYLEKIKSSNVLCEINQENQLGLTVRALEALFFNKKLITNNVAVKEYDFYCPANILVLNEDTTEQELAHFLAVPFEKVGEQIIRNYEVTSWVKNVSLIKD